MKAKRISHLTAEQVAAVFKSERFCQLTDGQLAALHHRAEQLEVQQRHARARRRRWRLAAVVAVVVLVALAPIWHVLLGMGVVVMLWLLVIAWVWDAGLKITAKITGRRVAAAEEGSGQQRG
jgi:hypothetical protein